MSGSETGSVRIRPFRPADLPAIAAAAAQTAWDYLTPAEQAQTNPGDVGRRAVEQVRRVLAAPGAACFVAEQGGLLVGYEQVVLQVDEFSGIPEGLKVDGWVHPAYRGLGLNRLMHQAGEDWCRAQGARRMVAVVAAHNQASLRATEKTGFETVRVIRVKPL